MNRDIRDEDFARIAQETAVVGPRGGFEDRVMAAIAVEGASVELPMEPPSFGAAILRAARFALPSAVLIAALAVTVSFVETTSAEASAEVADAAASYLVEDFEL